MTCLSTGCTIFRDAPASAVELSCTHHLMKLNEDNSTHEEHARCRHHPNSTAVIIAHSFSTRFYSQTCFAPQIACHASGTEHPKARNSVMCSLLFISKRWVRTPSAPHVPAARQCVPHIIVLSCLCFQLRTVRLVVHDPTRVQLQLFSHRALKYALRTATQFSECDIRHLVSLNHTGGRWYVLSALS